MGISLARLSWPCDRRQGGAPGHSWRPPAHDMAGPREVRARRGERLDEGRSHKVASQELTRAHGAKGETTLFGRILVGSGGNGAEPHRLRSFVAKGDWNWCKVAGKKREGGVDRERRWGEE